MPIYIGAMKAYTTPEVAKLAGVHVRTLHRWMRSGAVGQPERVKIGGLTARLWREGDIDRVKKHKHATYRKGRGRKAKQNTSR
jgi:DNA-binding transcriptional MerR regulator